MEQSSTFTCHHPPPPFPAKQLLTWQWHEAAQAIVQALLATPSISVVGIVYCHTSCCVIVTPPPANVSVPDVARPGMGQISTIDITNNL